MQRVKICKIRTKRKKAQNKFGWGERNLRWGRRKMRNPNPFGGDGNYAWGNVSCCCGMRSKREREKNLSSPRNFAVEAFVMRTNLCQLCYYYCLFMFLFVFLFLLLTIIITVIYSFFIFISCVLCIFLFWRKFYTAHQLSMPENLWIITSTSRYPYKN